ncbi:MAG: 16S rRNA (adenine(1518)-N(6)/adenine(1519)-N(6))-dimethyltransferase RsmA [Azospirillaceae bacterium]
MADASRDDDDPVAGLPPLRAVIAALGLSARRSLGQNFLLDLNLTRRIARAAGPLDTGTVIEVGPGPGGLTRALLLEGARHVVAIERDRRFVAALAPLVAASNGRLEILEDDALAVPAHALGQAPRRIVANLPYNIATPLLIGWLARIEDFASITAMFQKEVADRLLAPPGSRTYGRLSVIVQWAARVRPLMTLPPRAFTPPPKVESTVVQLTPRADRETAAMADLERVTQVAFGQRRKMLRASLRPLGGEDLARRAGLDPTMRAEDVDIAGFVRLANAAAGS